MTSRKLRFFATAGVLALLLVGGVAWLVRVVTDASQSDVPVPIASAGATSGPAPEPGTTVGSLTATPERSRATAASTGPRPAETVPRTTGAPGPPMPVHSIRVSGPLGGGPMDDSCRLFTNEYSLTLTLKAIRLVQDDSELVLEHNHCPDDNFQFIQDLKPCQVNDELKPGGTCYSGVVLADADEPGEGVASGVIVLTLQARCTGVDLAPCSDEEVIALAPSPEKPVLIRWDDECSNCEVSVPRRRDLAPQTETPLPSATSPDPDHTP